ncbi:MAG: hypothetical protein R2699_14630 [Acidimicrobiales bacterium]
MSPTCSGTTATRRRPPRPSRVRAPTPSATSATSTTTATYLADRASRTIISGGVNIYPAEIEQILGEHPAVADVAVFGSPTTSGASRSTPRCNPSPGRRARLLAAELQAHVRAHLAGYKVPRSVAFRPDLGRLPSGKVPIRHLRAPYWAGRDRSI